MPTTKVKRTEEFRVVYTADEVRKAFGLPDDAVLFEVVPAESDPVCGGSSVEDRTRWKLLAVHTRTYEG